MHALALHLALTDALYGEDAPPLILDDPFISFDDGRLSAGKKMLYALGCERQVIYLTCSSSRMP